MWGYLSVFNKALTDDVRSWILSFESTRSGSNGTNPTAAKLFFEKRLRKLVGMLR